MRYPAVSAAGRFIPVSLSDGVSMKIVGVKERSQILSVKPSTLYQWAELGQMPCIKLNGALRFDIDDVHSWINSCKKTVTSSYNPLVQTRGPRRGGKD